MDTRHIKSAWEVKSRYEGKLKLISSYPSRGSARQEQPFMNSLEEKAASWNSSGNVGTTNARILKEDGLLYRADS